MVNTTIVENKIVSDGGNEDIHKKAEFELFVLWCSIPPLMRFPPIPKDKSMAPPSARTFAMSMGIDDERFLDLIDIKTDGEFQQKYGLGINTTTRWRKIIRDNGLNGFSGMRNWAMEMSRNVLMAVYQHAIKKGNPFTMKLWFQIVNEWEEKTKVEHKFIPVTDIEHEIYDPLKHGKKEIEVGEVPEATGSVQLP